MMNRRIKAAFDRVEAETELMDKTEAAVLRFVTQRKRRTVLLYRSALAMAACMVLMVFGGFQMYFKPTTQISIDINPSMVLEVNRFGHVISAEGRNEDGVMLLDSLDITFMNYSEAVEQIVNSETVSTLLDHGELLSIGVIGQDGSRSEEIYSAMQHCVDQRNSVHCYYANFEEVAAARELGLTYVRYQAYRILQEHGHDVEVDEIKDMSMRAIRNMIDELGIELEEQEKQELVGGKHKRGKH